MFKIMIKVTETMDKKLKQLTFNTPYPDRTLNPNVVKHFYEKAKVKANARIIGYNLAKEYSNEFAEGVRLKIDLTVHRKDLRKYDLDNVLASCKAILDGVFSGLQCDDSQIDKIVIRRGEIDKLNPRIVLLITEIMI